MQLDIVLIKKADCLTCNHLCGDLGTNNFDCFNTRGCPAASYNITVGTDIIKAADDLANAWATNDSERIATLTNKISNYHDAVKTKIFNIAKAKLKEL